MLSMYIKRSFYTLYSVAHKIAQVPSTTAIHAKHTMYTTQLGYEYYFYFTAAYITLSSSSLIEDLSEISSICALICLPYVH